MDKSRLTNTYNDASESQIFVETHLSSKDNIHESAKDGDDAMRRSFSTVKQSSVINKV